MHTSCPAGGITVTLLGGRYRRTEPLILAADDSGVAGSPIRWRAEPGEAVSVHGAEVLDPSWFAPLAPGDPIRTAFIDPAAVGNADDGYPNYHADFGGGEHAYLYDCTWGDGERHKYWFISPYDPTTDSNCWPTDERAWWGHGTNLIPLMEPLSGTAQDDVVVHDMPRGTAESGFVFTPAAIFTDDFESGDTGRWSSVAP